MLQPGVLGASLSAQVIYISLSLVFKKKSSLMCVLSEGFPAAGGVGAEQAGGSCGTIPNHTHRIRCCLWRGTRSYRSAVEFQPVQKLGLSSSLSRTIGFPKQQVVVVSSERKRDFFLFLTKKKRRQNNFSSVILLLPACLEVCPSPSAPKGEAGVSDPPKSWCLQLVHVTELLAVVPEDSLPRGARKDSPGVCVSPRTARCI